MVVIKLAGEAPQAVQRASVVVLCPRSTQLVLDPGAVALGQVIEDVALSLKLCGAVKGSLVEIGLLGWAGR